MRNCRKLIQCDWCEDWFDMRSLAVPGLELFVNPDDWIQLQEGTVVHQLHNRECLMHHLSKARSCQ